MSLQTTDSDLFVELSAEQEELVSGGGQLTKLILGKYASYHASETVVANQVVAGPNGASANFLLGNAAIESYASDFADLKFD